MRLAPEQADLDMTYSPDFLLTMNLLVKSELEPFVPLVTQNKLKSPTLVIRVVWTKGSLVWAGVKGCIVIVTSCVSVNIRRIPLVNIHNIIDVHLGVNLKGEQVCPKTYAP